MVSVPLRAHKARNAPCPGGSVDASITSTSPCTSLHTRKGALLPVIKTRDARGLQGCSLSNYHTSSEAEMRMGKRVVLRPCQRCFFCYIRERCGHTMGEGLMATLRDLDCLVVGYNDLDFNEFAAAQRLHQGHTGALS